MSWCCWTLESPENADETTGVQIVTRAIEEPLRQIVANSGNEGSVIVAKVKEGKGDYGYNAKQEKFEKLPNELKKIKSYIFDRSG